MIQYWHAAIIVLPLLIMPITHSQPHYRTTPLVSMPDFIIKPPQQQVHYRRRRHLIIGGHDVARGRYPFFVSIDKNNGVVLNGALIAPDIVLSAGHITTSNMDNLTLKVGAYAVHHDDDDNETSTVVTTASDEGETIPVERWVVPTNWSQFAPEFFANDFCILKLKRKSSIAPIALNRDARVPFLNSTVTMLGLGWTNQSFSSPANIVQQVDLLAISNAECEERSDATRGISYDGMIVPSMLCTVAPPNTTRDGCAWDSGAPVIVTDKSGQDRLVAVGSTGIDCADPVFPGIQARISDSYQWIEEQVCKLSLDPPRDFHCKKYRHGAESTKSNNNKTESINATESAAPPDTPLQANDMQTATITVDVVAPTTTTTTVPAIDDDNNNTITVPENPLSPDVPPPIGQMDSMVTSASGDVFLTTDALFPSSHIRSHHHTSYMIMMLASALVAMIAMILILVKAKKRTPPARNAPNLEQAKLVDVEKQRAYGAL